MAKYIAERHFVMDQGNIVKPGEELTINKTDKMDAEKLLKAGFISEPKKASAPASSDSSEK